MFLFSSALFTAARSSLRRAFVHSSPAALDDSMNGTSNYRKVLPSELLKNVVRLTCQSAAKGGICDVYVVGTTHGTEKSCQQVKDVISFIKPQAVFLELCLSRYKEFEPGVFSGIIAKINQFEKCEFHVGNVEAKKYGAKVVPGDRSLDITLRRTWAKMSLWHPIKILFTLPFVSQCFPLFTLPFISQYFPKTIEETNNKLDVDTPTHLSQEMRDYSPILVETFLDERDQYMSTLLFKLARKHNSVVAVVGKAHLPGIQKYWKQPIDVEPLLVIPDENILTFGMVLTVVLISCPLIIILDRITKS